MKTNTLFLNPTDVLFFRDGRPMSGSLSGHGAAWPLPTVANAALHAALHRAEFDDVHSHRRGRSGQYTDTRDRKFGALLSAGPFPVSPAGEWYFPRPLDTGSDTGSPMRVTYLPLADFDRDSSSLPQPLKCPVVHMGEPSKDSPKAWCHADAYQSYLDQTDQAALCIDDADFFDAEQQIGIGLDAETGAQDNERFYSAHYLRLKAGWQLGLLADAHDKIKGDQNNRRDLVAELFKGDNHVVIGGQQRVCSVRREEAPPIPLPCGKTNDFETNDGIVRVKWTLLSPAIFPAINDHPGGWLPTWIDQQGKVQLLDGPGKNAAKRRGVDPGKPIEATLVAAMTGKAVPVTGYALPCETTEHSGPKPTHLAVPAGSVYYFECQSSGAAEKLAKALNWHAADTAPTTIHNRRSSLFGEKGFGIGVCSSWEPTFHNP